VKVELLFFAGCPGYEQLVPGLRELVAEAGAALELRNVETSEEAEALRFLGSPTVRVDGRDVEPGAEARSDYGLKCRLYRSAPGGHSPMPSVAWIRAALHRPAGARDC
jgi:hypothetical protein